MGFRVSREELDEAKDGGGARWDNPLAPGTYPLKCLYGGMEVSKSSGNEMMKFTFLVDAPPTAAPEGDVKLDYYVANAWSAKNFLMALAPASLGGTEEVEIEPGDFVDAECRGKVVAEKYEGSTRAKLSHLLPLEPEKGEKKAPATKAKPATAAKPAAAPAKEPAPATAPGAAPADDSDVPF
jgi:hypothetical protein